MAQYPIIDVWAQPVLAESFQKLPEVLRLFEQSGSVHLLGQDITPDQLVDIMDNAGIERLMLAAWFESPTDVVYAVANQKVTATSVIQLKKDEEAKVYKHTHIKVVPAGKDSNSIFEGLNQRYYETEFIAHRQKWEDLWQTADIQIKGDEVAQVGIRFTTYHVSNTYHIVSKIMAITVKWNNKSKTLIETVFADPYTLEEFIEARKKWHRMIKGVERVVPILLDMRDSFDPPDGIMRQFIAIHRTPHPRQGHIYLIGMLNIHRLQST